MMMFYSSKHFSLQDYCSYRKSRHASNFKL